MLNNMGVVTSLWNCLPDEVVSGPSVKAFKARLDKYWNSCQFSLYPETFLQRQLVNSQKIILASKAEEEGKGKGKGKVVQVHIECIAPPGLE